LCWARGSAAGGKDRGSTIVVEIYDSGVEGCITIQIIVFPIFARRRGPERVEAVEKVNTCARHFIYLTYYFGSGYLIGPQNALIPDGKEDQQ
jgi:hypothetical protein